MISCAFLFGGCLQRISIPYVYNLAEALQPLTGVAQGQKRSEQLYVLYNAHSTLNSFLYSSVYSQTMKMCVNPGQKLLDQLNSMVGKDEEELDYVETIFLSRALSNFKTIFEAEFQFAGTFLVPARRGYDILTLLEMAEVNFPQNLMKKVPHVLFDLREAGRCIAFDLGTAAGFHLLRALETVIGCYWDVVMSGKPLPSNRNLGAYIKAMEDAAVGDGKVLSALKQIKDLHRNSLMHPEETLDLDKAFALMGIVQSAMDAMLLVIPDVPPKESGLLEATR